MDAKFLHFLHIISSIFISSTALTVPPQDNHLIKCGSSKNYVVVDNRYFVGDSSQKPPPYYHLSQQGKSIALINPNPLSNSSVLHSSARIFTSTSIYAFKIKNPGTHFIRLHFYPFRYGNYNLNNGDFSVVANGFSLLSNFGANFTGVKEFLSMVDKLKKIEIMFTPTRDSNFAFVNAIEVFLAPKNLFFGGINQESKANIRSQMLETVHRVNVGGPKLTPSNDTLWRSWVSDEDFLVLKSASRVANTTNPPNYRPGLATRDHAPDSVYMTARQMNVANGSWSLFNVTWDFPVSYGRDTHLIRLHFCDIVSASLDTLYFNVYINGITAYENVDLSALTFRHLSSPYYIDFVVKNTIDSGFVRISIGPSDMSTLKKNAILNGVEIMRVVYSSTRSKRRSVSVLVVLVVVGCFLALSLFLAIFAFSSKKRKRRSSASARWTSLRSSFASPGPHGYYDLKIPFSEIQLATNDFDSTLIIESGNLSVIYKGVLKDNTTVAVKRGVTFQEFETEITVLSRIRHCHIISLVGFCEEQFESNILVYEYMEKGSLRNHLYGSNNDLPPLSWKQRLGICINAARGLHYLHTGSNQVIVHCDIKSNNILLDENYLAKVSGFGLASTDDVEGSLVKSDVHAFGVVLVEVLCGRHVVVEEWRKRGAIERIVDRRMVGEVKKGSLEKFVDTVEKCLGECGVGTPSMGDVLWNLEWAYRLQMD